MQKSHAITPFSRMHWILAYASKVQTLILSMLFCAVMSSTTSATNNDDAEFDSFFDDAPKPRNLKHPDWFKSSFLDLRADVQEAREAGKLGIIVYFEQEHCAYCEKLIEINFGQQTDIADYTQKYFDVIAVDAWGDLELTTPDGQRMTEKDFAEREGTNFSPSLLFYNVWGQEIFRMRGYYPPYRFRAGLDYVVGSFYHQERFREYLERAEPPMVFEDEALASHEMFAKPPYLLARQHNVANRPLLVLFEQGDCHACDVLHSNTLQNEALVAQLEQLDVVQLNMWGQTPVQTPDGARLTARQWAAQLNLFFSPTLVFFDQQGAEIIRVDSSVQLYRLQKVLEYVLSGAYKQYPRFQRWHMEKVLRKPTS